MIREFKIHRVSTTESTQAEVLKFQSELREDNLIVVIAKKQTSGRGRYSRKWIQFEDSLIFSFMVNPISKSESIWSQVSYIVGIAIVESLLKLDTNLDLELKWVNDILLSKKKICGILLERYGESPLIVGVAVNLKGENSELPNATSIANFTDKVNKDELEKLIFDRLIFYYNLWIDKGFEPIKSLWLKRAKGVGKEITVNRIDSSVSGVFLGIDDIGNLQLLKDNKIQLINAGEIYFGAEKEYESART